MTTPTTEDGVGAPHTDPNHRPVMPPVLPSPEEDHHSKGPTAPRDSSDSSTEDAHAYPQDSGMKGEREGAALPPTAEDSSSEPPTENVSPDPASQQRREVVGNTTIDIRAEDNKGQMIGQLIQAVQRHSGAPLDKEWIEQQLKDYLPLRNQDQAIELLTANRVLVLSADKPGSGRWTAALHLLSNICEKDVTIRRIRRDSGDSFSMEGLKGEPDSGWILDLRDPDESIPEKCDLGHELHQTQDLVADGSYLVVLVSTELWKRIGHGAGSFRLTLDPPESSELFTAFLRSYRVAHPEKWVKDHRFAEDVQHLRPGQVREWAQAVSLSYSQHAAATGRNPESFGEADVEKIAKAARNAVTGWMDVLLKWHSDPHRTSYERNYLLLVAVLGGAPVDRIHRTDGLHTTVTSLAQAFGEKGERAVPLAGQQGPGLIQLTRQVGAELLPNAWLRFPGPGFEEAVVRYFWQDRPGLTDDFTKWTAQLAINLKPPYGPQLAERMAPWAVHHAQATRSTRLLRVVATDWSENRDLAPHARDLLVTASLDPQIGHLTRNALGTWIKDPNTEAPLLKTLAWTCQRLAPAHPVQMLGRFGVLASSAKDRVADTVGEVIDQLWNDEDLRPRLLRTLISWLDSGQEAPRQSAASAFLNLARQCDDEGRPILMRELEATDGDWVIRGWRTVLEASEPTRLACEAGAVWLDAAVTSEAIRGQITAAFVEAVHTTDHLRGRRHMNLGRLADNWVLNGSVLDQQARRPYSRALMDRTDEADPYRTRSWEDAGPTGA